MESKTTLYLVIAAVAIWFLFLRKKAVVVGAGVSYRPPPPPTTAQTIVATGVAVAPALGSFLSSIAKGFGSSTGGGNSSSSSDDLMAPSFADSSDTSAFSDESFSFG
jgi:hypothetical protein